MLKFIFKSIFILLVIAAIAVFGFGGSLVKYAVENVGSKVAGTPVRLAHADLDVLKGHILLTGLAVENPAGYKSKNAISFGAIDVQVQPKSLLSKKIRVDFIRIADTAVSFEGGLTGNNIEDLQRRLASNMQPVPQASAPATPSAPTQPQQETTFEVTDLSVTGTNVTFTLKDIPLKQESMSATVSDIHLRNVGTADKGATAQEVMNAVLVPLFRNIQKQALKEIGGIGDQLKQLESGEFMNNMKDQIGDKLKGLFN